jgi:hypothetical protein
MNFLEVTQTVLICAGTLLFIALFLLKDKLLTSVLDSDAVNNKIQTVLNDMGESFREGLTNMLESPAVSRANTIIGRLGHESRADDALKDKVADKLLQSNPLIGKALEYFDLTPMEGLSLINDPTLGPLIQSFIQKAQEGLGKGFRPGGSQGTGQRPATKY